MKYYIVEFKWRFDQIFLDSPLHEVLADENALRALERAERLDQLEIFKSTELIRYKSIPNHEAII